MIYFQLLPNLLAGSIYFLSTPFQFIGREATECKLLYNNIANNNDNIAHNNVTNNNDNIADDNITNNNNITKSIYRLQQYLYNILQYILCATILSVKVLNSFEHSFSHSDALLLNIMKHNIIMLLLKIAN